MKIYDMKSRRDGAMIEALRCLENQVSAMKSLFISWCNDGLMLVRCLLSRWLRFADCLLRRYCRTSYDDIYGTAVKHQCHEASVAYNVYDKAIKYRPCRWAEASSSVEMRPPCHFIICLFDSGRRSAQMLILISRLDNFAGLYERAMLL